MILKQNTLTFGILAAAFVCSALYQLFRSMLMEVPKHDAFTVTTGIAYAVFVVISALVLTDRRWAWWVVLVFVFALLALGTLWYHPVVTVTRIEAGTFATLGWVEDSIYVGLLFVAGFLCVLRLLDARLVSGKG